MNLVNFSGHLTMKPKNNTVVSLGIFSAIAASMCCIAPVLAFLAGASSLATTFSWLEPARPILIGITILILAFAWYQKLRLTIACDCEDGKMSFFQTKTFLGIITVIVGGLLTFPYYTEIFYPKAQSEEIVVVKSQNIRHAEFKIEGMTCEGCTAHVNNEVGKLDGIIEAIASYEDGTATVKFDSSKTSVGEITKAIDSTGYKVTKSYVKDK